MNNLTQESVIEAARFAAEKANGPLSLKDFLQSLDLSEDRFRKLFPDGGWSEVRIRAGIERHPQHKAALSDDEILLEYHRVVCELSDIPSWHQFGSRSKMSHSVVSKRFGGREGTLTKYRSWLELHHPDFPLLPKLQSEKRAVILNPASEVRPLRNHLEWSKAESSITYGAPINFRGLRHAPINEQGVVYLFGMVSAELGLIVEAVQSAFPDCEAKRCVDSNRDRWQRVRVEFEYYSSNFKDHRHDATKCDMIVCWEHDWSDCPLEVIELRQVIQNLKG